MSFSLDLLMEECIHSCQTYMLPKRCGAVLPVLEVL
uniref:Uncharacterized protein n=1 Tax=Arundo donax TaxID=35708 RepID=A0A0A9BHD5_ARUDO